MNRLVVDTGSGDTEGEPSSSLPARFQAMEEAGVDIPEDLNRWRGNRDQKPALGTRSAL